MKLFQFLKPKKKKVFFLDNIKVVKSPSRKKTITLRIKKGSPEILCPLHTREEVLRSFINSKNEWLLKKVTNQVKEIEKIKALNTDYLLFKGKRFRIKSISKVSNVRISKGIISLSEKKFNKDKKKFATKYLVHKAIIYLHARVKQISEEIKINYDGLKIRKYKRIWGCCINQKTINLNWKLIMLPTDIINYIIIHELCHVIEPNHSKKFWNLVRKFDPKFERKKKWLKTNGSYIIQF